jgi:hypothetical protein
MVFQSVKRTAEIAIRSIVRFTDFARPVMLPSTEVLGY